MPLMGKQRTRRPMERKEARTVSEDPPPTNNGVPEEPPARQDVDVLLDVSELEVDKIHLKVRSRRAHVSVLAELASLVNLQIGVDARLDLVELEIEGVRAKVLLKVRLDNVRAILVHALAPRRSTAGGWHGPPAPRAPPTPRPPAAAPPARPTRPRPTPPSRASLT